MQDDLIDAVLSELDRHPEVTSLMSSGYWDACRDAAEGVLEAATDFVGVHLAQREQERAAVRERWGDALDGLTLHWLLCRSVASIADWDASRHRSGHEPLSRARRHVFWTAHHVGEEALVLLRSGLPTGAQARWRAMCELELRLALLDLSNDERVAVAYHDHSRIRKYQELEYELVVRRSEGEEVARGDGARPASEREALLSRYGREFLGEFGWAHGFLQSADERYRKAAKKGDRPRGPSLDDVVSFIEDAKDTRAHLRLRYAYSSAAVHGDPRVSADLEPTGELVPWAAPVIEHLAHAAVDLTVTLARLTDRYAWWLPEDSTYNSDLLTGVLDQLAGLVIQRIRTAHA